MRILKVGLYAFIFVIILMGCDNGSATNPNVGPDPHAAPMAPSLLTASMAPGGDVLLTWNDNSNNEDGFEVFESITNDSNYVRVATTRANENSTRLLNRSLREIYFYRVRAFNINGYSAWTNSVNIQAGGLWKTLSPIDAPILSVDFFFDGSEILSGSGEYKVRLWDVEAGAPKKEISGHTRKVDIVQYSVDHTKILSVSREAREIMIWNAQSGGLIKQLGGTFARFSPDGSYLVIRDAESNIRMFNIDGTGEGTFIESNWGTWFDFTGDGRYLFVFQSDSLRKMRFPEIGLEQVFQITGMANGTSFALSPDGQILCASVNKEIVFAQLGNRTAPQVRMEHTQPIQKVIFSPDGNWIVSGAQDWLVKIWDANTGESLYTLTGHQYAIYDLAFTDDGSLLASASGDRRIRIWGPFK